VKRCTKSPNHIINEEDTQIHQFNHINEKIMQVHELNHIINEEVVTSSLHHHHACSAKQDSLDLHWFAFALLTLL